VIFIFGVNHDNLFLCQFKPGIYLDVANCQKLAAK